MEEEKDKQGDEVNRQTSHLQPEPRCRCFCSANCCRGSAAWFGSGKDERSQREPAEQALRSRASSQLCAFKVYNGDGNMRKGDGPGTKACLLEPRVSESRDLAVKQDVSPGTSLPPVSRRVDHRLFSEGEPSDQRSEGRPRHEPESRSVDARWRKPSPD